MSGCLLRRTLPVLGRLNLPAAVLGGLLVSLAVLAAHTCAESSRSGSTRLPSAGVGAGGEASAEGDGYPVLKKVVAVLMAMWAGSYVSAGFAALGITLPAYIGAMLVAALVRNVDDVTGWFGLSARLLGAVALSLFLPLALALMNLKLWELAGLALPLLVMLGAQVVMVMAVSAYVFRRMGGDYDGAVMSGGLIGFMLGRTANALLITAALNLLG